MRFEPCPGGTTVTITHGRIATPAARDEHEQGWVGCLNGLAALVEAA